MGLSATVRGHVQGVGFRVWVREVAQRMSLRGFVRNMPDGSVYVLAFGSPPALQTLLRLLHEGPPQAHVASVSYEWTSAGTDNVGERFEVRH